MFSNLSRKLLQTVKLSVVHLYQKQMKNYEVIETSQKSGMYRIIDESKEDYLYPTNFFEVIEEWWKTNQKSLKNFFKKN